MNALILATVTLGYLAAHFALYALVLRTRTSLWSERTIFRYHWVSALISGAGALVLCARTQPADAVASLASVIAAHGIYSLSFLEVWSLAQGGYSLHILEQVDIAAADSTELDRDALVALGRAKQADRIAVLVAFGLVARDAGHIWLTPQGRLVARVLRAISAMARMSQQA